jgi:hypothetical protein
VAGASLRHEGSIRAGRDLEVEDIGSVALVEDEEDLREVAIACGGFKVDDLVDAGLEEAEMLVRHWSVL